MNAPLSGITKSKFNKLRKSIGSDKGIGRKYGVTRQAIYNLRVRLNIPPTRTPDSLEKRNIKICADFKKGIPVLVLAKKYKLTVVYVYFLRRKFYK
jgi:hypothetical protein